MKASATRPALSTDMRRAGKNWGALAHDVLAGSRHGGRDVAVRRPHGHDRGPAYHRVVRPLIAGSVPGDDCYPDLLALPVHGAPEGDELLFGDGQGQVQVDGHVAGRQS